MKTRFLICQIALVVLLGCGGSDDSTSTPSAPTPPVKQIDYPLQNDTLRIYELGDYTSYVFNYDKTYSDGSGSYWNGGEMEWEVSADPFEYTYKNSKSLISKYTTNIDGFIETQLYERFIQPERTDFPKVSKGIHLISDFDKVIVDTNKSYQLYCIAYNVLENTCYQVPTTPSIFKIGDTWSYEGKSTRQTYGQTNDPENYYDSKLSWKVEAIENIETELGVFETYRLKTFRELSYQSGTNRFYYVTEGYYWYYPKIGVVKANISKSQRLSGYQQPYILNNIDYTIKYTNIAF